MTTRHEGPEVDDDGFAEFSAVLRAWSSNPAMTLVDLPEDLSDLLEATGRPAGFGSLKVEVICGPLTWLTSVFPEERGYVLPIKKAVRVANDVGLGDRASFRIRLVH